MKEKKEKKITKAKLEKLAKRERNRLYEEWRQKVKLEFGDKCVLCGDNIRVNCHHIFPKEVKELKFEVLNGVALCSTHHKYSIEISPHKNPIVFLNWYQKNYKERYDKLIILYNGLNKQYSI